MLNCLPTVNTLAPLYTHPVVDMPSPCQYPTVDTVAHHWYAYPTVIVVICGARDDVPEGMNAHILQWGEGQGKDLSGDLADALGPNMTHLSAGSGRNSKKLTPGWVSHTMGLLLLFPMPPVMPPNSQKHKKGAYIPHWRGEARWQLQARTWDLWKYE